MFSSKTDEWETPQVLFDQLNKEFNFDLDVCANRENRNMIVIFEAGD
jgi:site-specific DNA-methyltransferase (adenine-specific)